MNRHLEGLGGSASMEMMDLARQCRESGMEVLDLSGGEPDFPTPEVVKDACIQALRDDQTHYAVGPGIIPLRSKIAQSMKDRNGIEVAPEQIVVTPGGKPAIFLALYVLLNEGDEVLVPDPSWVSYKPVVRSLGAVPVSVKLQAENGYFLDYDLLEQMVTDRTKVLILNYPNNPTGRILHQKELDGLVKLLEKHPNLYILSDEVYDTIVFDGMKNLSPAAVIKDRVLTVNSFSKSLAMTGWRLGWLAGPKQVMDKAAAVFNQVFTQAPTFLQLAAVPALDLNEEMAAMRLDYQERRDLFTGLLNGIPGVRVDVPEGAFYAWVQFDLLKDAKTIVKELIEDYGLFGVNGAAYGESDHAYVRFSFAADRDALEKAACAVKSYMKKQREELS